MPQTTDQLKAAIMNLPCDTNSEPLLRSVACVASPVLAYALGHRDARHAAAELVSAVPLVAEAPPGMMLVPDWKGYALLGTGRYCLENSAAPPDPELGAELIIRPAKAVDVAGERKLYEERDTDGGSIQPEDMAIRIGFLTAEALDALESQLRHLRRENFPESVAAPPVSLAPMPEPTDEQIHALWVKHVGTHTSNIAFARAVLASVAPQPEQPNTDSVHLADNGRKAVQGLDAAAGVAVDDTALNDAQLAALRADVIKRAEAIPGGPFQMYEKGRYTGLMNAIDPRSPHCTRDPALAAEFHARLIAEVAAMTSNTEKEPK